MLENSVPSTEPTVTRPLRRSFVKGLLGSTSFWMVGGHAHWAEALAEESKQPYHPSFFTPDEYRLLESATERLFPQDQHGPGALALGVAEFIDRQMETPYAQGDNWYMSAPFVQGPANLGYQLPFVPRDLYRKGLQGLDAYTRQQHGKSFPDLPVAEQDAILTALEGGSVSLGDIPGRVFFEQLRTNTLEGVFSDPLYGGNRGLGGWLMLGFPGARADFMDWVNQDGAAYPFGPVSISGETA
ncbi:gluconate 2-dehydrogenase subunit 3 family protein [Gluconobacter cerinus]|uniref:gluconate 2-dehydrogenase subunit 3 family protein n=1 Tax=Gluconobacter cerinus TaxID=38307 RepID=UPI001B8BE72E|nr:gluconate 2-dehydrogenase subunit 3 family protein [Gluconobacter cerinus]MBS1019881.1 gluconate 2-dehydrogenase subunit 3 family protein [Gluconobacter cerinus]